ncbi:MAG: nucleotide exchange factor GrpE [Pelosinus sp.]|nr:nucleotide exchange factor GrpE [Pelosinus sp.]
MTEEENLNKEQPSAAVETEAASEPLEESPGETNEVCFDYKEVHKMMETIEEKNRLFEEQTDRLKRLQADFENFRRRTRQEKEELSLIVAQGVILELLPVVDNFERALQSAANQDAKVLLEGVQMIYNQLTGVLEKVGLAPIEAVGQNFDPQQHEAIMSVQDEEQTDGAIIEELQKGYTIRGKVVRPSMVKVVNNG